MCNFNIIVGLYMHLNRFYEFQGGFTYILECGIGMRKRQTMRI